MRLAIDSNIVFSVIISKKGKTAELLFKKEVEVFAPKMLIEELDEHKQELIQKSGMVLEEFELFKIAIFSKLKFVPNSELFPFIERADEICPDPDDVAFFALCLSKGIPLWSNDKKLKQQKLVKVINTEELVKEFI